MDQKCGLPSMRQRRSVVGVRLVNWKRKENTRVGPACNKHQRFQNGECERALENRREWPFRGAKVVR